MGVVRLCWCFGVLLVLVPAINARNVKLVPAGTKTITTDGATHEISRYIFVPDDESNDLNADNEKNLQVIHNTTKNDDANIHFEDSKVNTLKNQSENVYNVHSKTRIDKHKNIVTAKGPDVVKYNVVLSDNNYENNHENNAKVAQSLIKAKNDAQVNAENTKFAIKVMPLHQESKSNVYHNGNEGGEKITLRKHLDQSNDVLHHHQTGQSLSAGSTKNTVLDLNIDNDHSETDVSSSENSARDSWHVKTKTKYKPTKITNIRIAGLPIKWDTESGDETEDYPLHASIGINKTFTLPGKRGRFKLIYEDDDYNDENAVLERPILHTRTSKSQNKTRLNINEKHGETIKIIGDTETNKERLLLFKIKTNNQDRDTTPVQKDTHLDTNTENVSENGYVERLSLKTKDTKVSPQRNNIEITETNFGYPKLEVIESHSGSLAKHEDEGTSTLLSNTNISVDRKPNLQVNTEVSKSETKPTKKEQTLSDTNEVDKTFTKTTTPILSSNQSAEIISKTVIEEVEPNIKLTKSFMPIENHTEVIPPNEYVVFSNDRVTSESVIENSKTASLVNDKIDIENETIQPAKTKSLSHSIKTVNTTVPSTIIKVSSFENQGNVAKARPDTVSINISSNPGEAETKTSIVPNDNPNVDIVKTVTTVTKSNVNESTIADNEIVQIPGSLKIVTGSKNNVSITGSPKEGDPNLLIDLNVLVPKTENYFVAGKLTQNDNQIEIDSEEHSKTKTTSTSENLGDMHRYSQINKKLNQTDKLLRPLHEIAKPSEVIKVLHKTENNHSTTKNEIPVQANTDIAEPTIQSVSNSAEFSTQSKSENTEINNNNPNTILNLPQIKIKPLEETVMSTNFLPNATTKSDEINVLKKETIKLVYDHENFINNTNPTNKISLHQNLMQDISNNSNPNVKLERHNTKVLPTIEKINVQGETELKHKVPSLKKTTLVDNHDNLRNNMDTTNEMSLPPNLITESKNTNKTIKLGKHNADELPAKVKNIASDKTEKRAIMPSHKGSKTKIPEYDHNINDLNSTDKMISPLDLLPESNNIDVNDKMEEHNTNVPPTNETILTPDQTETSNEMLPLKGTETLEDDYNNFAIMNPTNTMISPLDPMLESNNIDVNVKLGNLDSNVLPIKISSPGEINTVSFEPLDDISKAVIMASNEEDNEGHELEVFPLVSTKSDLTEYPFKKDDSGSSRITYRDEYSDIQPAKPKRINLASKKKNDDSFRNRYNYSSAGREYPVHTYTYRHNYPYQAFNGYTTQSNDPNVGGIDDEYLKHILHHLLSSNNQQYGAAGQETDPSAIRLASIIRYLRTLGIKLSPEQLQFLTQQIYQQKLVKNRNHNVIPLMVNQIIIPSQNVYILPYFNSHKGATEKRNRIHDDNVNTNNNIAYLSNRVYNIATYLKTIGIPDAVLNKYIAEVKQYLNPEFIRPVVTECQKKTYAGLVERIDVITAQVLQRSKLNKPRSYHHQYTTPTPQYYHN